MSFGILGKKLGMSQIFDAEGRRIPVTLIDTKGCVITAIKTADRDGYVAVQVGYQEAREKRTAKAQKGDFAKKSIQLKRHLREFRVRDAKFVEQLKVGQELTVDNFKKDSKVDVTGISKGRGYTGVVKRYGFKGHPASHGTHQYYRHPGSIGCRFPQHTHKGKRFPGHMGVDRVTIQNLTVADIDSKKSCLAVMGALPGAKGQLVFVKPAVKQAS